MLRVSLIILLSLASFLSKASEALFPMKGLSINPPAKENVGRFCNFIKSELKPLGVNTLFLRIDWKYAFESYPQMATKQSLTKTDVKQIVKACKEAGIELIPVVNLLGHQSWGTRMNRLLEVFPQFDETPRVRLPKSASEKNSDGLFPGGLYCKSYCPLHPDLHKVVFSLVGEIIDVFEAKSFHAGMDEVIDIGHEACPRCSGKDKARLFADEANKINSFVKSKGAKMWIWGDRLIDGKLNGMHFTSASSNNTAPAIDLIDKDISVFDWHYRKPEVSAAYFAFKGFNVASCPHHIPEVALQQLANTIAFRRSSSRVVRERFIGMVDTDWGKCEAFMDEFTLLKGGKILPKESSAATTITLFERIKALESAALPKK